MKEEFIMKPSSRFPGAIGGKTPAKNTHGFGKKITAVIAASAIALCGTATTAFADDTANDLSKKIVNTYTSQNGNGMTFEKVSHPSNGLQTADGVVDYIGNGAITEEDQGQGDRGQSYSYAAASYGDWVYVGTMYGGLGVQNILSRGFASNMGMTTDEATALIQTMYSGHMYLGEPDGKSAGGMLFKFNVKTGESKILMSQSAGIEGGTGIIPTFRSAFRVGDKLYFEGMVMDTNNKDLTQTEIQTAIAYQNGFPCIYEIDPTNGDKLTPVYESMENADQWRELVKQNVFTSTRAIGSFGDDTLIAGDLKPTSDGKGAAYLVASKTPSIKGSYKVIADMADFDNLPAIHRSDVNGGGGIYQVQEFNGKLYVVICTGSTDTRSDETGTMRSYAIYVGENNGDPTNKADWTWRPLAGDKSNGAKYTYGLDASRVSAGACTLQVYGDYLYIGDYNDVSSALQGFVTNSEFVTQATNLEQSINLYRMDKNENITMVVGDENETFGKSLTGLGSGYGNHMNQYTWQTITHEGKMYLSTMNTTTLLEPVAQFTNGDILHMSDKEWNDTIHYLRTFLELVMNRNNSSDANAVALNDDEADAEAQSEAPSSDDPEALVDWAVKQANQRAAASHPSLTDVEGSTADSFTLTKDQKNDLVDGIKDGSIVPGSLTDVNTAATLLDVNNGLDMLGDELGSKASEDFSDTYGEIVDEFMAVVPNAPQIPDSMKKLYDTLVKLTSKENMKAYFKALPYLSQSKRGFNLFEIVDNGENGVSVSTVTDEGFGDPFNHGLRIFCNTDNYMMIGTANPFYGTQLWRVANTVYSVNVKAGKGGKASADYTENVAPGTKVTLTATADKGYAFDGWTVTSGNVEIAEDGTFTMPSSAVYVKANFKTVPSDPKKEDSKKTETVAKKKNGKIASTGSSVMGFVVAGVAALIVGAGALMLKKKRA